VMNRHKLVVNKRLLQKDYESSVGAAETLGERASLYSGFFQLTHITRQRGALRHDDRIEALAAAVGQFAERMAQDEEKQKQALLERGFDEEIRLFLKQANIHKPRPNLLSRNTHGRSSRPSARHRVNSRT